MPDGTKFQIHNRKKRDAGGVKSFERPFAVCSDVVEFLANLPVSSDSDRVCGRLLSVSTHSSSQTAVEEASVCAITTRTLLALKSVETARDLDDLPL